MTIENAVGKKILLIMVLIVGVSCIGLLACGGNEEADQQSAGDVATESATEDAPPSDAAPDMPTGWQAAGFQGWAFALPASWSGDPDVGVWWHGEGDIRRGRPPVSMHSGGIPVMPSSSFEDKLMARTNEKPQERKTVTIAGCSGCTCTWDVMGKKHLGLFLEEKTGGGMSIVHFVDCQAPTAEFDKFRADFEQIVASVHK